MEQTYDYIIVGAGSAGCILANRLSASGEHSVLLVEAGGKDNGFWFRIPVGFARMYYNPRYNWMYYSEPEPQLDNRSIYCPRGKVQGGSGAINAMVYVRGAAADFDDWAAAGNPGWGYQDVLPAFRQMETHPKGDTPYHGSSGPINISPMRDEVHPLCHHFLHACLESGWSVTDDFNGALLEGGGIYDVNTRNGQRCSSSVAYLKPVLKRANLTVMHHTLVAKVLIDGELRATGVVLVPSDGGETYTAAARKEVILAAGAVDTPKIMQLSGLGDAGELAEHQIPVVRHLPAVGRNLQDHLCASYYYHSRMKTLNDEFGSVWGQFRLGLKYLLQRKGALAMSVNQAGGFFKTDPALTRANIQLYFNPLSYQIPKDPNASLKPEPYSGFLLAFNPTRPSSRGTVTLASPDVRQAMKIAPHYLSTQQDIDDVLQGSQLVRRLMQSPALREVTLAEMLPGAQVQTPDEMLDYFRKNAGSIYHLCGSCAMGPYEATSVVDRRLRVHGLQGLRIVDASIFPNITSGNTNAATMMVAERAAAMILEDVH